MSVTSPALRYHGAKFRLASWVMSFFPEHTCYVEPFGGAAGVLLQKPRVYAEVYNDLDREVVNFFRVLRDPAQRQRLLEAVILTPYARDEFDLAWEDTEDPVESARRLCIRAQMGFGSAGATKGSTGFRVDTKREYGTAQHLWQTYPAAVAAAGERLTGVLIENQPATKCMQQHDSPSTLHFVDPPYVHSTRVLRANGGYRHEMTDNQHHELIDTLRGLEGFVVLSGYPSELYMRRLSDWECQSTTSRISSGRGGALREEVVWLNQACSEALRREQAQQDIFSLIEATA
jgi:DNA adenine methylase